MIFARTRRSTTRSPSSARFADVVEMWTRYLEANPRDGRAHLERGGAFFHLGRRDEARADAKAACDLGVSEGCARAH
jgi:Flp pilus assembly protein TadD